MTALTRKCFF